VTSTFAADATELDGCDWNADGSRLYAADRPSQHILGYDRAGKRVFDVFVGHHPDGVAAAPKNDVVQGLNVSGNVFVNDNDGPVLRIDTRRANAVTVVLGGGTRGDFGFVDSKGYFDVSQTSNYLRLRPSFFGKRAAR
jgi:hypothetical protein